MAVNVRLYLTWSIPREFNVFSLQLGGVQSVLKNPREVSRCWTMSRQRWPPSRKGGGFAVELVLRSEALHVVVQGVGPLYFPISAATAKKLYAVAEAAPMAGR